MRKKEKFVRFLKEEGNDVYHKFVHNFKDDVEFRSRFSGKPIKSFDYYLNKTKIDLFINDAFFWDDTKEGFHFWEDLHYRWLNICYSRRKVWG